ncbi:MAG: MOSC domain-containing protein [Candidatus Acetothermia bacterium]
MTGRDRQKRKLISINVSEETGTRKRPVDSAVMVTDHGIEGDVHAGSPIKQVSLLDETEITAMEERSGVDLSPGDFAENLTTQGVDHDGIGLGDRLFIGDEVELEVSQIGKSCHDDCIVKAKTGECIMPQKGLFLRVLSGGSISPGDEIAFAPEEE